MPETVVATALAVAAGAPAWEQGFFAVKVVAFLQLFANGKVGIHLMDEPYPFTKEKHGFVCCILLY